MQRALWKPFGLLLADSTESFYLGKFITHLEVISDSWFPSDDEKLVPNRIKDHFASWSWAWAVRSFDRRPDFVGGIKYPKIIKFRGVIGSSKHVNQLAFLVECVGSMRALLWPRGEFLILWLEFGKLSFVLLLSDEFLNIAFCGSNY